MELQNYCDNMSNELNAWKSKIHDVVRKLDQSSCGDKARVVPQVNELHMIMEELGDRIEKLRTECSTEWAPEQFGLESQFTHMKKTWEGVWQDVSPAEFGG
jgi:hypothetical protein